MGVDYVLNSLAEEKLIASVRCLAQGGHFLEVGKFDLAKDNPLSLEFFKKNISYHGVMLDALFDKTPEEKRKLLDIVQDGIRDGYVKPMVRSVFPKNDIETAFRYMGTGKHIGKVLINIRSEEHKKTIAPQNVLTTGRAR